MEAPTDVDQLCADLGISHKRRGRLAAEYGEHLIPYLQKLWRWSKRQDEGRFLHRHATAGAPDYVDNPVMGMKGEEGGEPEAVSEEVQAQLSARAKATHGVLHAEEERRREIRSLTQRIRALSSQAARCGLDTTPELEAIKAQLASLEGRLKEAA